MEVLAGILPAPIKIDTQHGRAIIPINDTIWIEHGNNLENKIVSIESNAASLLKSATSERVRAEEILSVLGIATSHVGIKSLEENVAQSDIRLRAAFTI